MNTSIILLTMKAQISRRTNEKRFEEVCVGQIVDVPGDVDVPAGHGNGASEPEEAVQVEGGDLRVVALEVREVEVVGKGLLGKEKT